MFNINTAAAALEALDELDTQLRDGKVEPDQLNAYVLRRAEAWGVAHMFTRVEQAEKWATEHGADAKGVATAALAEVLDVLLEGPDDTWSGRGNDVRRAQYDGVRQAGKEIRRRLARTLDI